MFVNSTRFKQVCQLLLSLIVASWILDHRDSILMSEDSILATRNSKRSSFETRGLSLDFRASSVNLLLSGTVNFLVELKPLFLESLQGS